MSDKLSFVKFTTLQSSNIRIRNLKLVEDYETIKQFNIEFNIKEPVALDSSGKYVGIMISDASDVIQSATIVEFNQFLGNEWSVTGKLTYRYNMILTISKIQK